MCAMPREKSGGMVGQDRTANVNGSKASVTNTNNGGETGGAKGHEGLQPGQQRDVREGEIRARDGPYLPGGGIPAKSHLPAEKGGGHGPNSPRFDQPGTKDGAENGGLDEGHVAGGGT